MRRILGQQSRGPPRGSCTHSAAAQRALCSRLGTGETLETVTRPHRGSPLRHVVTPRPELSETASAWRRAAQGAHARLRLGQEPREAGDHPGCFLFRPEVSSTTRSSQAMETTQTAIDGWTDKVDKRLVQQDVIRPGIHCRKSWHRLHFIPRATGAPLE